MAIFRKYNGAAVSDVVVTQVQTSGTRIAEINGVLIYAPSGGGGGGGGSTQDIAIQIPDKVYAVVGTELNIWDDTISLSIDRGLQSPINYYVEWNCGKGKITDRGFRYTPVVGDVGTHSCTCYLYDNWGNLLAQKTFQIVVKAKNALASAKNILFVSDSLGASSYSNTNANFSDANRFGGTVPTIYNESTGGWHWGSYATEGTTMQRIQVSGVTALNVGAIYTTDGTWYYEIREVNLTDGAGNVLVKKYNHSPYGIQDLPLPSGTLTRVSGSGDASFTYTNGVNEAGNPFWHDGGIDIAYYRSRKNIANQFDMVIFQLGVNNNNDINVSGRIQGYIDALYQAFIDDNPNCLFILSCTPICTNDQSALGANYGAQSKTWGITYAKNEYKFRELYNVLATASENYPNLKVVGTNLNVDRYYGYQKSLKNISDRCTEQNYEHLNYVHPTTSGYQQIGDSLFASIIGLFT